MSKQCRFYLLPSDVESLLEDLRNRVPLKVISSRSPTLAPAEVQSPLSEYIFKPTKTKVLCADCYLVPADGAEIKMHYLPKQRQWAVSEVSEAIEFSGCDYDGETLRVGRLYLQTDQLIVDGLWPKREEFLRWADKVLQTTKRLLKRSKTLNAYVGKDAAAWERKGGHFRDL
jgi:hypothetical protein